MANPNPATRSDYRDHLENPKLRTRDVLIWIWEEEHQTVTSRMVAQKFNLGIAEGASRLGGLKLWGCLRVLERGSGSRPNLWTITDWGIKMAKKWKAEAEEEE